MSEGLGFAQALKRVAHDCVHQIEYAESSAPVGLYPKSQIVPELRLENGDPLNLPLHPAFLAGVLLLWRASVSRAQRVEAPRSSAAHSEASAANVRSR